MKFRITDDGSEKDIEDIRRSLRQYNLSRLELLEDKPLGIFLEDGNGEKLAGLTGETFGNWLCIKFLWVSEQLRGGGIGRELMAAAENEAKSRGCKYAFVNTFDFQAPEFYRKLGYKDAFALTEYPLTGSKFYYTKTLA